MTSTTHQMAKKYPQRGYPPRFPSYPRETIDENIQVDLLQEAQRTTTCTFPRHRAQTPPSLIDGSFNNSKITKKQGDRFDEHKKTNSRMVSPPGFRIMRKYGMWPPYGTLIPVPSSGPSPFSAPSTFHKPTMRNQKAQVGDSATTQSTSSSESDGDSLIMQPSSGAAEGLVRVKKEPDIPTDDRNNNGIDGIDDKAVLERNSLDRYSAQSQCNSDGTRIKEEPLEERGNISSSAQSSSNNTDSGSSEPSESSGGSVHAVAGQTDFDDSPSSDGIVINEEDTDSNSSDERVGPLSGYMTDEDDNEYEDNEDDEYEEDDEDDEDKSEDGSGSDEDDNESDYDAPVMIKLEDVSSGSSSSSEGVPVKQEEDESRFHIIQGLESMDQEGEGINQRPQSSTNGVEDSQILVQQQNTSRTSSWIQNIINNSCSGTEVHLLYDVVDKKVGLQLIRKREQTEDDLSGTDLRKRQKTAGDSSEAISASTVMEGYLSELQHMIERDASALTPLVPLHNKLINLGFDCSSALFNTMTKDNVLVIVNELNDMYCELHAEALLMKPEERMNVEAADKSQERSRKEIDHYDNSLSRVSFVITKLTELPVYVLQEQEQEEPTPFHILKRKQADAVVFDVDRRMRQKNAHHTDQYSICSEQLTADSPSNVDMRICLENYLFEVKYMLCHEIHTLSPGSLLRAELMQFHAQCAIIKIKDLGMNDVLRLILELEMSYSKLQEEMGGREKAEHFNSCQTRLKFMSNKLAKLLG